MKRFEQAVLQVESYNMDTILQGFKRSISLDTPFFKPSPKPAKNSKAGSSKPSNNQSKQGERKQDRREQQPLKLTPLIVSYKQLLSLIQELPKFRWPELIKTDSARILINLRSSANLLQMSAYRQMGYSWSALENLGRILTRFSGASIVSLGDVILPIQADPVTLNVRFSVVEDLSPYNAIMDGWLPDNAIR
ncbi:hypothetical protein CK203_060935 [Vitis vinifera]|uniref:Uncharacterized protein n=1 Tax=Vitis vinifera TaxID=29760 RepID=A0A438GGP3_VITVI|nr:hypothetical protein CK203_060935 [Vitis vinifera]